jgi:hypothetical protein
MPNMTFTATVFHDAEVVGSAWTTSVEYTAYEPGEPGGKYTSPMALALRKAAEDPYGLLDYGDKIFIAKQE